MKSLISVKSLSRFFISHIREPGFKGAIKSLFSRKYLTKNAVSNVTFDVGEGEILGLIGANGAGKTTLVKMLSGIIFPSSGSATILGFTPHERKYPFRKQIALVMGQKAQLWWDLPAEDCFLLLKDIYGIEDSQFQESLEELVTMLEVKSLLGVQVRRLSLGERMKMEIIASLLHRPKVIFLDEPTIGLDITSQRSLRRFLREYQQKYKPAIILTSHYMEDIEQLCERVVIMREGAVVYDGQLKALTQRFSPRKTVRGAIKEGTVSPSTIKQLGMELSKDGVFEFKTSSHDTSEALRLLLSEVVLTDITIEEEDISLLIERVMRGE
jgi:ABC-2 type transport system ATP-binding protein